MKPTLKQKFLCGLKYPLKIPKTSLGKKLTYYFSVSLNQPAFLQAFKKDC